MFVANIVYLGFKAPTASQRGSMRMSGKHNQTICGKCERRKRKGNEAGKQQGCFPVYLARLSVSNCFSPWRLKKGKKKKTEKREREFQYDKTKLYHYRFRFLHREICTSL